MSIDLTTAGGAQFGKFYEGQVAEGRLRTTTSRVCSTAAGIAYGKPVAQDATGGCQLADSTHQKYLGISCMRRDRYADSSGHVKYQQYDQVSILETGAIGILATENYKDGDAVMCLFDGDGKFTGFGSASGGAADGSTRIAMPNASYESEDSTQPVVVGTGVVATAVLRASRTITATT